MHNSTLRGVTAPIQYQPGESVRGPWERALVEAGFSTTEGGARQRLMRLQDDLKVVAAAAVRAQAVPRFFAFLAPIEAVIENAPAPVFDADLLHRENEADGDEDTAVGAYLMQRDEARRRAALKAIHRNIARLTELARAIAAEGA